MILFILLAIFGKFAFLETNVFCMSKYMYNIIHIVSLIFEK